MSAWPRKGIVVTIGGQIRPMTINDFEHLQKLVGGWVEAIRFGVTGLDALINEEGKLIPLPPNRKATELCSMFEVGLRPGDFISGNMVLLGPVNDDGDWTDVPEEWAKEILPAE